METHVKSRSKQPRLLCRTWPLCRHDLWTCVAASRICWKREALRPSLDGECLLKLKLPLSTGSGFAMPVKPNKHAAGHSSHSEIEPQERVSYIWSSTGIECCPECLSKQSYQLHRRCICLTVKCHGLLLEEVVLRCFNKWWIYRKYMKNCVLYNSYRYVIFLRKPRTSKNYISYILLGKNQGPAKIKDLELLNRPRKINNQP